MKQTFNQMLESQININNVNKQELNRSNDEFAEKLMWGGVVNITEDGARKSISEYWKRRGIDIYEDVCCKTCRCKCRSNRLNRRFETIS